MRRGWRPDPHTLAGAHALDALTEADRVRFERHLASCESCRQEADGLRETAGRMAAATAVPPPPGLRARVLAAAARTRQSAPVTGPVRRGARAGEGARRAGRRMPLTHMPRFAIAIAGFAILIALGVGALTVSTAHRLGAEMARGHDIAAVLTAPDATMMQAHATSGGMATVVMSHRHRELVLTTAHLPTLPAGDNYEVWVMGPGGTRAAGMLPPPRQDMTSPIIVAGLAAGDRIGLTVEPAAGSARPTGEPVLMLTLPS